MNTAFEIVSIPLNKLVASPLNVRKTGGQTIEDLAASIQAHGLLHNLVVAKKGDKHHVIAGARRFAALRKLAKQKAIPKTFDVPCRVIESCYEVGSCLSLTSEKGGCRLDSHAKGIETSLAQVRLSEIHSQWLKRIPAEAEELWQWLLDQDQTVVIELLAFCIGQTVHAVRLHHDGRQPRFVAADQLAKAVQLDMAEWWTPTGESYLARVKKDQILEAIEQGTAETNFEDLRKMKKAELVDAAERRLAESRWLPEILRS